MKRCPVIGGRREQDAVCAAQAVALCCLLRAIPHMDLRLPRAVALLFENPHGVAGDESLLAGVAHPLDARCGGLPGIPAVRCGLDDVEGVISDAELDPV